MVHVYSLEGCHDIKFEQLKKCCGVEGQSANTISTLTILPQPSNWEELTSSRQALKEATNAKKEKFSCVLNLLKNALSEELENPQCHITEELIQDSALSSLNSIFEEEQIRKLTDDDPDKQGLLNHNKTESEKALYQKIITKIASALSKTSNNTNEQNNIEVPSMIPIFKPRPVKQKTELGISEVDIYPAPKKIPKSRAIAFVPEKIIQTNINQVPSLLPFNIPCQRAADVLDMTNIAIPKEPAHINVNDKSNVASIAETTKSKMQTQIPSPVTLSVNSADSEDTVAMLFKPRNISLMQLYGNLLKKITITVLVPYHMSKLVHT